MADTEADTCRKYVLPNLYAAGWTDEQISEQKFFTDGRIITVGKRHIRKPGKKADYVLRYRSDSAIAVVEAKRSFKKPADGLQQAMEYAEILGLKFAYSTNGKGIVEHDFITGKQREIASFPSPTELWTRLRADLKLGNDEDADDYLFPFNRELRNPDGTLKMPRYFQQTAIDRAVHAVIGNRKRLLITMATGTGKTFVAAQIVWKLWKTGRKKRILYLADRNILIQQPLNREFSIFGDAVWPIRGEAKKGREIYFALYQAIAEDDSKPGLYKEYPRDYFDLIIVDECHRGSAKDESNWREILEYFTSATQIGMTATPKHRDNVNTYEYFGNPIYKYSLAAGIDDGFLAPFRVHRVVPNVDATGWRPIAGQMDRYGRTIPDGLYTTRDFERTISLLSRTATVAHHLTEFLKKTDRFAKTIVFCVDQEHAEQMRLALHNANSDLTREHPHYVARIVNDEGDIGRKHLGDFQDPEKRTPVIVTTSQLLTTGVDVPTCRNIALVKVIQSMIEFKQIIGRGTRLYADKDKLSFNILDYSGATRLFADPEFDGEPELLTEEQIDENGDPIPLVQEAELREPREEFEAGEPQPPEDDRELRKFYVDGVSVAIAAETVFELDANGRRVRAVRYTDYTADQVRTLYPSASTLRKNWSQPEERAAVLQALSERGVTPEALAEATGQPEADPLDLLIHVAWRGPLHTRRERVERVRSEGKRFFDQFTDIARLVLNDLLEKYAEHGVQELDDLGILEIPPISGRGTVVEIASAFGGPKKLKQAVSELQKLLYVA